jgi:hypothetical protein
METLEVPWAGPQPGLCQPDAVGRPRRGTILSRNSTDTSWFQELARLATAICLLRGREPKTGEHYPLQGQVALYFGTDAGAS